MPNAKRSIAMALFLRVPVLAVLAGLLLGVPVLALLFVVLPLAMVANVLIGGVVIGTVQAVRENGLRPVLARIGDILISHIV